MKFRAATTACRRVLIAAALLAVIGMGACGGDDALDAREIKAAEQVMHAWATAWERHDGAGICTTLTQEMQDRYGTGLEGCARATSAQSRKLPVEGPTRVRVREGEGGSRITGDIMPASSPLGGGEVTLVEVDGRWLIDEDLTCQFPSCD